MKASTILALFYAVKVCVVVQGRYQLEVRLNGYENRDGKCIGCPRDQSDTIHSCCDDFSRFSDCGGNRRCDSYFIFCLRPFGSQRERYDCQTFYNDTKMTSVNDNDDGPIDFTDETVLDLENPFLLPGLTEEYEGVQLYIVVYDEDTGTRNREGTNEPDDLVDIVVINHNQPVRLQSQRQSTTGSYVSISVNITVLCAQNFGGSDCTQCVPGFTGPDCDEVDNCIGVNCGNGRCVDGVNSFSCTCNPGFTGPNCDEIDDCVGVTSTCSGNGQCVDGVDSFSCTCDPGFIGELCQTNIDDCVSVDCSGNGECVDGVNNFTCECMTGYSGPLCSEASDSVSTSGSRILAGALGGGIAGALLLSILMLLAAIVACHLSRKSKVISRSEPLAQQGDSDVTDKPTQQIQSDQLFELKSNEAYGSTTHYVPTEDNVAYIQTAPQISKEDNNYYSVPYSQTAPQIPTEDNVAYGHWDCTSNPN